MTSLQGCEGIQAGGACDGNGTQVQPRGAMAQVAHGQGWISIRARALITTREGKGGGPGALGAEGPKLGHPWGSGSLGTEIGLELTKGRSLVASMRARVVGGWAAPLRSRGQARRGEGARLRAGGWPQGHGACTGPGRVEGREDLTG